MVASVSVLDRDVTRAMRDAMSPVPRSRREFFEAEIFLPDGPCKGERFSVATQPYTGLLIDELDRDVWPETYITGPSQSGKTIIAHVLPVIYAAVELRRNVVVGIPDGKMATDKWLVDFRPMFLASPTLRTLLPRTGPGSQGGSVKDYVQLANGCVIRFMTAGGDDTARAGFTAEGGVFVTEAARWSHSSETSVEASPLEQLRARMQATRRRDRRLLIEGTLTTELELPWTAHKESTQSRIITECPHCGVWVTPEREHLVGWHDADSEIEAAESALWSCPHCGHVITADERKSMNREAKLIHVGQTINKKGKTVGDPPRTERLWFRWSMFHNLLLDACDIAPDEWKASRMEPESEQREAEEKKLQQFVWCMPYSPPDVVVDALKPGDVAARASVLPKGELPEATRWLSIGCDGGKYSLHWVAVAGQLRVVGDQRILSAHVVDYETIAVLKKQDRESAMERNEAVELALCRALDTLGERCKIGWSLGGVRKTPDRIIADAGWMSHVFHSWCRRAGTPFFPAIGRGTGQLAGHSYAHPSKKNETVRYLGDEYHIKRSAKHRTWYFVGNSDHWKRAAIRGLGLAEGNAGCITLHRDQQHKHATFDRHVTAEQVTVTLHKRHGRIEQFENPKGKPNHYFDALWLALMGLDHAGYRLTDEHVDAAPPSTSAENAILPGAGPVVSGQSQTWWSQRKSSTR